ncbi:uncharacterized protein UMAG_05377 [Mycosarcoma maydis]|uniref:Uncharacterized protein n=1 Tax=Mycosarcoma maydis TaxID=5270 RepID=A0A0D1CHD2_MYCMD|nr:uncharacterized protein UMAG_05377 [Ustilago maydis 521]KIS66383.1 hypothetical protein UMAG_05377 [Ustilago maydis 521]|eukprot:XP_011392072.1 hypothetical protein UMAG_05377 [Ustilago maydis 521]
MLASSSSSPLRTLGLHERYAVARRCVDSASVVSVAAILQLDSVEQPQCDTNQAFEALRSHLASRIDQVLTQYPLLGYCVQAPRSKSPRWAPIVPTPTSNDILHVAPPICTQQASHVTTTVLSKAILDAQLALPKSTCLHKDALWKVQVSWIQDEQKKGRSCLVVLSTDHVINDGRGTLNLFQMLLRSDSLVQSDSATTPDRTVIPPASDKVFNLRPSITYMLGEAWRELILPKLPLPRNVKARLCPPASWPMSAWTCKDRRHSVAGGNQIVGASWQCKPDLDVILVSSPNLISNIKKLSRTHVDPTARKPATMHSIIHTLALVALFAAVTQSHDSDNSGDSGFQLVLESATPISLRDQAGLTKRRKGKAHVRLPATTGNFVSSYTESYRLTGRESMWAFTHRFGSALASVKGQRLAKQHMGLLGYIPDFDDSMVKHPSEKRDDDQVLPSGAECDRRYLNGWEKFFGERAMSLTPYSSALTVSNLGLVQVSNVSIDAGSDSRWSVEAATWAQSHTPQGEAFNLDVVGFLNTHNSQRTECLSIALSTRPDAFANRSLFSTFKSYLQRLVLLFGADPLPPNQPKPELHNNTSQPSLDLTSDLTFASIALWLTSS